MERKISDLLMNSEDNVLLNSLVKEKISMVLHQRRIGLKNIILFGSRARGDFDENSDYDLLIILNEALNVKEKIEVSEAIRTELAMQFISSDIIIKSSTEADYYKEKIGSIVREAFKDGVAL